MKAEKEEEEERDAFREREREERCLFQTHTLSLTHRERVCVYKCVLLRDEESESERVRKEGRKRERKRERRGENEYHGEQLQLDCAL